MEIDGNKGDHGGGRISLISNLACCMFLSISLTGRILEIGQSRTQFGVLEYA